MYMCIYIYMCAYVHNSFYYFSSFFARLSDTTEILKDTVGTCTTMFFNTSVASERRLIYIYIHIYIYITYTFVENSTLEGRSVSYTMQNEGRRKPRARLCIIYIYTHIYIYIHTPTYWYVDLVYICFHMSNMYWHQDTSKLLQWTNMLCP